MGQAARTNATFRRTTNKRQALDNQRTGGGFGKASIRCQMRGISVARWRRCESTFPRWSTNRLRIRMEERGSVTRCGRFATKPGEVPKPREVPSGGLPAGDQHVPSLGSVRYGPRGTGQEYFCQETPSNATQRDPSFLQPKSYPCYYG